MAFSILEHLAKLNIIKEESSYIEAYCPACFQKNMKINRNTGAYSCFSGGCSAKEIKDAIGLKLKDLPFRATCFSRSPFIRPERIKSVAVELPKDFISVFFESTNFIKPESVTYYNEKYGQVTSIYYSYTETQRVHRISYGNEKKLYPQHLLNEEWVYGTGSLSWPLYNEKYLHKSSCNSVLIVEGEKCASIGTEFLQWVVLSPSSFSWTPVALDKLFINLKTKGVKLIVYMPDCDFPGRLKADKVKESAYSAGIAYFEFNIKDYWEEASVGDDLVDLLNAENGTVILLKNFIRDGIRTCLFDESLPYRIQKRA